MFDIFTEEIEFLIKEGITNLYWFKEDLRKAWLRAGVEKRICDNLFSKRDEEGKQLTKRALMSELYQELRSYDYNKKLEISRNFVKFLVEHQNFVPQSEKHDIAKAEQCALKLKEIIVRQNKEREQKEQKIKNNHSEEKNNYYLKLSELNLLFQTIIKLEEHKRGFKFEELFTKLMDISKIQVQKPFKIEGEQIDGAIKYEGHYYLLELKWTKNKTNGSDVGNFYYKVEGKMDSKGIIISINGFSDEILKSLPRGKDLRIMLLDGVHFVNILSGIYTFKELLDYAISEASLKGCIFCSYDLK